jgi:Spy/CpxP family protein refolding chaperone
MVTKSQLWASVLLISTFAAGAVVGGGVMSAWGDRGPRPSERPRNAGERGFSGTLKRELNLTDAQRDSVRAILRRYDPAFRAVMEGTRPTFDSLRALVHADIRRVLTEEQKTAFEKWVARMDSSTARRRETERNRNAEKKEKDRAR